MTQDYGGCSLVFSAPTEPDQSPPPTPKPDQSPPPTPKPEQDAVNQTDCRMDTTGMSLAEYHAL